MANQPISNLELLKQEFVMNMGPSKSRLLALPHELILKILAFVTDEYAEHMLPRWKVVDFQPLKALHNKLNSLTICKKLYYLALPAHFSENTLVTTLTRRLFRETKGDRLMYGVKAIVEHGTFEETPIFLRRTQKLALRGQIRDESAIFYYRWKVRELVDGCEALAVLIFDMDNVHVYFADQLQREIKAVAKEAVLSRSRVIRVEFEGTAKTSEYWAPKKKRDEKMPWED